MKIFPSIIESLTLVLLMYFFASLDIAASELDSNTAYSLGYMYDFGDDLPRNYKKAVFWYENSIELGNVAAHNNLGYMYENGYGVTKNLKKAVNLYRIAANQGHAKSQHELGTLYINGRGVDKNPKKALMWYQKAAKQGFAFSFIDLSNMYKWGVGVSQNEKMADKYYLEASLQVKILRLLKRHKFDIPSNYEETAYQVRKVAEKDDAELAYYLALILEQGLGVPKDKNQAIKWYMKSAKGGYYSAQKRLADFYLEGQGVTQNYLAAFKWYSMSIWYKALYHIVTIIKILILFHLCIVIVWLLKKRKIFFPIMLSIGCIFIGINVIENLVFTL